LDSQLEDSCPHLLSDGLSHQAAHNVSANQTKEEDYELLDESELRLANVDYCGILCVDKTALLFNRSRD